MIFTLGIKYLFSEGKDNVDISKLSFEDFELMNRYFKSMGFEIFLKKYNISEYLENIKLPSFLMLVSTDGPSSSYQTS